MQLRVSEKKTKSVADIGMLKLIFKIMMKRLSISLLALITFVISISCKEPILGPNYPITDLSEYDYVVVATIDKAVHEDQRYQPLKTFKATIKKSLKGTLVIGTQINGKAKMEEQRAVCPVHLDENSDYLLLLTKSESEYSLSRFSMPVKKGYMYFDDYISQIEKLLSKKGKN